MEKLAQMLEDADALAGEDLDECSVCERSESEKAAARQALSAVKTMKKMFRK